MSSYWFCCSCVFFVFQTRSADSAYCWVQPSSVTCTSASTHGKNSNLHCVRRCPSVVKMTPTRLWLKVETVKKKSSLQQKLSTEHFLTMFTSSLWNWFNQLWICWRLKTAGLHFLRDRKQPSSSLGPVSLCCVSSHQGVSEGFLRYKWSDELLDGDVYFSSKQHQDSKWPSTYS